MVSPFFGLGAATPIDEKERSKEFENTIGNLLVAEFQVHRLRERVKSFLSSKEDGKQVSEFMFRLNDEWFRINVSAQKQEEKKKQGEEEDKQQPSTGFALLTHHDPYVQYGEEPNEEYTAMP